MKLVFISNTFGHYQIPLCEKWNELCDEFRFITTKPMPDSMKKLGFTDWSQVYPYVTNAWENAESEAAAMKQCLDADVVVAGACDEKYLVQRFKANKLTFRFTERIFKKGKRSLLKPSNFRKLYRENTANRKKNYFVLCTGADCAADFRFIGMPKEKLLRWGYFPEVLPMDLDEVLAKRGDEKIRIIWVGRMVELKHPQEAILAAEHMKKLGLSFELKMLGIGPLEKELHTMVEEKHLSDCVLLPGSVPSEQVRQEMLNSHIFLMNSDKREGWGAVVSEAMGSGCAVVISDEAGAARVLVQQNETGIYYPCRDQQALNEALSRMVSDHALRHKASGKAYQQMCELWNGNVAAERVLSFSRQILSGQKPEYYPNGPMSAACEEQHYD